MNPNKQIPLKVFRSIISPNSLKELIYQDYNFMEPNKISLLSVGDNDHYLVDSKNGQFILRIYQYQKPWIEGKSDLLFELDWLTYLKGQGLPVSYPIKRKDSQYLGSLCAPEGIRYCALFTVAPGTTMRFNEKNFHKYGEIIAKIHLASNAFKTNYSRFDIDKKFLIDLPIKEILKFYKDADIKYLQILAANLKLKIDIFSQSMKADEWGIIGGDFHGKNHFSNSIGEMTLFDFDLCGYGWRAYDLSVFLRSLFLFCNKGKQKHKFFSLWNAFLRGYITYRSLTKYETSMIQIFAQTRQIWQMGLYIATYPEVVLNKAYLNEMILLLKQLHCYTVDS